MKHIDESFPPIVGTNPRVLILGTLPSVRSLQHQQYYAHPQNAFWWIMSQLFKLELDAPYQERVDQVAKRGIMIWDVIQSCHRPGSLDADIDRSTLIANDFSKVLNKASNISLIVFNGQSASKLFNKFVLNEEIFDGFSGKQIVMPSTSPANAVMSRESKLQKWQEMLDFL